MPLPIGLVYDAAGHVILDPDAAIQGAVAHLFATFEATGSATAVVKAFNAAGLPFPWRHRKGPRKDEVDWQPLGHHTVLRVLHNPRYAGAFAYGRTAHQARPGGKDSARKLPRDQWTSFIPGAHPGYITLDQYEANTARLTANAAAHGRDRTAGPPREGPALLQGLVICGRCGLRMTVRYHHRRDQQVPTYMCQRDGIENGQPACAAIPGGDLDQATGQLLITTLTPLAVEAALQVSAELEHRAAEADALRAAHVERARYHADLARRRYLSVDPANRLVAGTLEADWNTALRALSDARETYDKAREQHPGALTPAQQDKIARLVTDLPGTWNDPATPQRERKRIARLLLADVTVTRTSDTITAHVRLAGGQHRTLAIPAPLPIGDQRRTPADVLAAIDELLGQHTTGEIAGILNQRGTASGTGEPFHRLIVDHIIRTYRLRSRRSRLRATGMLTLAETAAAHHVHPHTIKACRRAGIVRAERHNDKGEHLYYPPDPANPPNRPKTGRQPRPLTSPDANSSRTIPKRCSMQPEVCPAGAACGREGCCSRGLSALPGAGGFCRPTRDRW